MSSTNRKQPGLVPGFFFERPGKALKESSPWSKPARADMPSSTQLAPSSEVKILTVKST
jgi:hypothetical protein